MQTEFTEHNQFTLAITCGWCGQCGSALWETTPAGRQLVDLKGFYERLAKKTFTLETVCGKCDRPHPSPWSAE